MVNVTDHIANAGKMVKSIQLNGRDMTEPKTEAACDRRVVLREAVDDIMQYQFSHSRDAMSALQRLVDAADDGAHEIERLRNRVERLRGLCKSASGWLLDADDVEHSEIVLDLVGDGEPSPYRTTPLLTMEQAAQMVTAERERCAKVCDDARAAIWEFHDKQVRDTAETVCINLAVQIRGA